MGAGADVGGTVRGVAKEVEAEVKRLIGYMNDEVVPEVRRSSSRGMRLAAEQLGRMAEHLDRAGAGRSSGGSAGQPAGGAPVRSPAQSGEGSPDGGVAGSAKF